jgi:hypothetical protein
MTDKPHVESMAETWQRQKPTTYRRTFYDGQDDHGTTDFTMRLSQIDPKFRLKLVDGGASGSFTIFFSDGSSCRMPEPIKPSPDKSAG